MEKIKITYLLISGLLLWGCNQTRELPEPDKIIEIKGVQDELAHQFGKLLAASLEEKPIRDFVNSEASLQFDGDYDILFAMSKDKEIQLENGRGKVSFAQALLGTVESARSDISEFDQLLMGLAMEYPTMQISVPQLENESVETWNTLTEIPLVAIVPSDYDESTHTFVWAYDQNGNASQISTLIEPSELVIVISPSERVLAFESSESENMRIDLSTCFLKDPIAKTITYDVYLMDDVHSDCGGDGGFPVPDDYPVLIDDTLTNCSIENTYQLQFDRIGIQKAESWISGAPEIKLWVYKMVDDKFQDMIKFPTMKPSKRNNIINQWWNINGGAGIDTFDWNKGDKVFYWFWEYDPRIYISIRLDNYDRCSNNFKQCYVDCGRLNGANYPDPTTLNPNERNCIEHWHENINKFEFEIKQGTCIGDRVYKGIVNAYGNAGGEFKFKNRLYPSN